MTEMLEFNCAITSDTGATVTVALAKNKGATKTLPRSWCSFANRRPPRDPAHQARAKKYPKVLRIPRVFAQQAGLV